MATAAASRINGTSRRTPSSPSPPPTSPAINKGGTARSAASPRVTSSLSSATAARRSSLKVSPASRLSDELRDSLETSLKRETEHKEQLLLQVQDKDQTIATLSAESEQLTSALNAAEVRLNELYAEQSRSEMELAQRIDISEKLRAQVRELEKEKRDLQRRYNEQTTTFEAERQAFYDNEQHLKSRIQSLTQARRQPDLLPPSMSVASTESEVENVEEYLQFSPRQAEDSKQEVSDPSTEPAEMTSLRLELSTLSTSYTSLQSTLVLLQTQLVDLKRVNHELQEENESYMILLREKTLSGQFDVMRQVGTASDDDEDDEDENGDEHSLRSTGHSTLDRVEEESLENIVDEFDDAQAQETTSSKSRHPVRQGRKPITSQGKAPRGETLADLPVAGPGLDLAAELGRAENKDILDGTHIDDRDRPVASGKAKRSKKGFDGRRITASDSSGLEPSSSLNDIDALRTEVKSLKDANKALSLYASKIIDRIIALEGFEHVLAVDYDKQPATPRTAIPPSKSPGKPPKPRPQSVIMGRSQSNPTTEADASRLPSSPAPSVLKHPSPPLAAATAKSQRRSLSFDWKSLSIFNTDKKPENPALKPLTLRPGTNAVTGARKLDNIEDEEDRKERERLNATMKLMGIQPPSSPVPVPSPAPAPTSPAPNRRFSLFNMVKSNSETSDSSSAHSMLSTKPSTNAGVGLGIGGSSNLTQEALEQAEAENSLAALDAHERSLSADIARGGSSGFTEIAPRGGRRSRRSAGGSGSGSTVWSAGMGRTEEEEE